MLRFGILLPIKFSEGAIDPKEFADYVRAAERLGFQAAWAHDRLLHPTYNCLEPISVLSYVAAITSKMKLGTQGLLLPLRNPAVLAKEVATLDNLSNGRVILGIVAGGGDKEKEGMAAGIKEERFKRFLEGIKTLRLLWESSGSVSYETPYWSLRGAVMLPRPKSRPRLPIWIGAYSDKQLERTARIGDGWLGGHLMTPESSAQFMEKLRGYCKAIGRDPNELGTCKPVYAIVDSDLQRARRRVAKYITNYYPPGAAGIDGREVVWGSQSKPGTLHVDDICALGPPDDVAKFLSRVAAGGVNEIIIDTLSSDVADLELFASKVIPNVKTPRRSRER